MASSQRPTPGPTPTTLTVERPSDFEGEYYVRVLLEWEPVATVPGVPLLGDVTVADFDMWIQNDPVVETAGPDEDGNLYSSAGATMPERINMFEPDGDFNILISQYTGVSPAYTLTIEWSTEPLPSPFEKLPPSFSSTGTLAPPPAAPAPVFRIPEDTSATPVFDTSGIDIPPALTPSVTPLADTAFDVGFDDAPSLSDQLGAPVNPDIEPVAVVKPSPPSNLALLLWLLALPLFLMAILGGALLRRRDDLITI
jgi:hypothetical protein